MSPVAARKSRSTGEKLETNCRRNISLDTSQLTIRTNAANLYENTPSPSSVASTSTIEHSVRDHRRILSSTLKNNHSQLAIKQRSRFERLFRQTQVVNRRYMMTMSNILVHMQREIYRLRRRPSRVEQSVSKQPKSVRPILRIPRLTKDQLSDIRIVDEDSDGQENETIPDANNNHIAAVDSVESKPEKEVKRLEATKARRLALLQRALGSNTSYDDAAMMTKRPRRSVWINHRQQPIDPQRYCPGCRHQYYSRNSFLTHIKNAHNGQIPLPADEKEQSTLEMNDETIAETTNEHENQQQTETTVDQSMTISDNQTMNQRKQPLHITSKPSRGGHTRAKAKCNICLKFFRPNYLKRHKRRTHPGHELLSAGSSHKNRLSDQRKSISTAAANGKNFMIAETLSNDAPPRSPANPNGTIVLAVTCLESHQLEAVEKFLKKFASRASQAASIDSRTTHLIANDETKPLRSPLSMKLIEAIAHHCFCVSFRWINDCLEHGRLVDELPYEIEGDDTDVNPHGGPRRSRTISTQHSLFRDMCFMIKCAENSDIRMSNERLEDLITTCGGQIVTCVTQRLLDQYQIIVLCDMLYVSERRHNYDQCRSLGIQFVSSDWVLESVLEYRRKPFSLFEEVPL